LLSLGGDVVDDSGEEVGGGEDLEVGLSVPGLAGAVDDGARLRIPGDFLEREWGAQQILGQPLTTLEVVGADEVGIGVDVEAAVFPGEEVGDFVVADEFGGVEGVEESVAEEFGELGEAVIGQTVEAALVIEEPMGGEDVEVGMEDEVVAERVDGGGGGEAAVREVEHGAEGVAQAGGGGVEEVSEEVAAFAEDRAKEFRNGEDELTVGNGQADVVGDPAGGLEGPALVAGGTEVAGLAGEGEQVLMAAAGTDEAGEAGGKVAATAEGLDGGDGFRPERAHGWTVLFFVAGNKIIPGTVDDVPER